MTNLLAYSFMIATMLAYQDSANTTPSKLTPSEIKIIDKFIKSQERIRHRELESFNLLENKELRRYHTNSSTGKTKGILAVRYDLNISNTWSEYLAIFNRHTMKCIAFGRVGGKGYRTTEIKQLRGDIVIMNTLNYSNSDALCCPSLPGSSTFAAVNGKLFENEVRIDCDSHK